MEPVLEKIYHNIETQYLEICDELKKTNTSSPSVPSSTESIFDFDRVIKYSKKLCIACPEYSKLMEYINLLATAWDEMIEQEFDRDARQEILRRKHSYILVPKGYIIEKVIPRTQTIPFAMMFNAADSPDNRIIAIVIDESLSVKDNINVVLHEVGHYIGCRKRIAIDGKVSRLDYQVALSIESFLRKIYLVACANLLSVDIDQVAYASVNDITLNLEKRAILSNMLECLSSNECYELFNLYIIQQIKTTKRIVVNKAIFDTFPDIRIQYKGDLKEEIDLYSCLTDLEIAENLISIKKINEVEREYLKGTNKIIFVAFEQAFNNHLDYKLKKVWKLKIKNEDMDDNAYRLLSKSLDQVILDKNNQSHSQTRIYQLICEAGELLEEIAADIFMCKIANIEAKYLKSMIKTIDTSGIINREDLLENNAHRTRLTSVQSACEDRECKNRKRVTRIIKKYFCFDMVEKSFTNRCAELDKRAAMLCTKNITARKNIDYIRIINPSFTAKEYATYILNDTRYERFIANNQPLIGKIRSIHNRNRRHIS